MNVRLLAPAHAKYSPLQVAAFPYSVVYTIEAGEILILAVAHQHRKPSYWQDRSS